MMGRGFTRDEAMRIIVATAQANGPNLGAP